MSSSNRNTGSPDAVSLLKADHRHVEGWFSQFEDSTSSTKKHQLAHTICDALIIHMTIEEEIFYPAFLKATEDKDEHHEAVVEHDAAKKLIGEIRSMSSADDYFDAKVKVLSEMIKHHVKDEEKTGGMFAEAKKSAMDLRDLGQQMARRKQDLQSHCQSRAA